jgi:hypothetical protein
VGGVAGVGALLEGVDVGVGFGVGIGVSVGLGVGWSGHETVTFEVVTDEAVPPSIVAMAAVYAVWPEGTKKWPAPRCSKVYTLPGASNGASSPSAWASTMAAVCVSRATRDTSVSNSAPTCRAGFGEGILRAFLGSKGLQRSNLRLKKAVPQTLPFT